MYHYSVTQTLHNPKLLHPMFQGKKPWIASIGAVILVAAVALLIVLPGWVDSFSYGDVDNAALTVEIPNPEEWDSQPDHFPKTWDVELGFQAIFKDFQVRFRRCALEELAYHPEFSNSYRQELEQISGTSWSFVITGSFTTGDTQVPDGLEPNTTYTDYQWVLESSGKIAAQGLHLLS